MSASRELRRLGGRISAEWTAKGRRARALPEIAARALEAVRDCLDAAALAEIAFGAAKLPRQTSLTQAFGEPPLTVHLEPDFYVEALFWHTGTTGIHQHRFHGAFMMIEGSSLHARYRFERERMLAKGLAFGELRLAEVEVLERGAVRPIPFGEALIHSAFHLDTPSVTLVVRTPERSGIEYEYRPPWLSIDPWTRPARTVKQIQMLDLMHRAGWGDYSHAVGEAIAASDLLSGYLLLSRARHHLEDRAFGRVEAAMRRRHGAVVGALVDVVEEERRRAIIVEQRRRVTDPGLRFFLGLVLNLPHEGDVRRMVEHRYGAGSAEQKIAAWMRALADYGIELSVTASRGACSGSSRRRDRCSA